MNIHEDFRYYLEDDKFWIEELAKRPNSQLWLPIPSGFDTELEAINEIKRRREERKQYERTYRYVE